MATVKQNFGGVTPLTSLSQIPTVAPTTQVINAANVGFASIIQPDDVSTHGAIVGCQVYCTAISSPVANSFRASLQSITARATGPTGTVLGGGSPASVTFTPAVGLISLTFANPYTPTNGTSLAIVIDSPSWVSGSATFNAKTTLTQTGTVYGMQEAAGVWSASGAGCVAPVYNDGFIGRACPVIGGSGSATSSGVLYGNSIVPTINMGCVGLATLLRPATSATLTAYLYEGTSTNMTSLTLRSTNTLVVDPSVISVSSALWQIIPMPLWEMVAGNTYRIMFSASSASTTGVYSSYPSQSLLAAMNGDMVGCSATSAVGTATDYNSGTDWRQYPVSPLLSYLSYNSGGVSGSRQFLGVHNQ